MGQESVAGAHWVAPPGAANVRRSISGIAAPYAQRAGRVVCLRQQTFCNGKGQEKNVQGAGGQGRGAARRPPIRRERRAAAYCHTRA